MDMTFSVGLRRKWSGEMKKEYKPEKTDYFVYLDFSWEGKLKTDKSQQEVYEMLNKNPCEAIKELFGVDLLKELRLEEVVVDYD